jgi:RNA-directed DNA polymerase
MLVIEQTKGHELTHWSQINWTHVEANVRQLQGRIYRATRANDFKKVKNLQKLMTRSMSAKLKAIRQVTQENRGKHTPGIDGVVCDTPETRMELVKDGLHLKGYRPKPVRRVYIPKADGRKRPLGIPTVKDRCIQALIKLALEPEWEQRFEANSYGFRPGRSTMDAIEAIHTNLSRRGCSEWILDADIAGCFDNIAHEPLLKRLPVFTAIIRRWLKAGTVEMGQYSDTEDGTPQGGVISPLLANIALDGMESLFGGENRRGYPVKPSNRKGLNHKISLVRYADDFVVTAPTQGVIESYVIPTVKDFLSKRGLEVNEVKTRTVHVTDGFDFLGFTIRRIRGKLVTFPQKEKVNTHIDRIRTYLKKHMQAPTGQVIRDLNPVIRGWTNYYRHSAASSLFTKVQYQVYWQLWAWAKRRHPRKSAKWIVKRYYHQVGNRNAVFSEGNAQILWHADTQISRYTKVSGKSSPMDPELEGYWAQREKRRTARATFQNQRRKMLADQRGKCGLCKQTLYASDLMDNHHMKPRHAGGDNKLGNLMLVHRWCHHAYHQRHGYKVTEA